MKKIKRFNAFNEYEYAKMLLSNGFITNFKRHELKILGKYYKHLNLSKAEIREKIQSFCEKYVDGYNLAKHFKLINSIMNYLKKPDSQLIMLDEIKITKQELQAVDNLDLDYEEKVFAFTLMAKQRLNKTLYALTHEKELNTSYFSNQATKQKEVFKLSKIKDKLSRMNDIIKILSDKGHVTIADNGKLRLDFLNGVEENEDYGLIIDLFSYENLGWFWDFYTKNPLIMRCTVCKLLIKKKHRNSTVQKYCKDCARKIDNEKTVKNRKDKRSESKINKKSSQ